MASLLVGTAFVCAAVPVDAAPVVSSAVVGSAVVVAATLGAFDVSGDDAVAQKQKHSNFQMAHLSCSIIK